MDAPLKPLRICAVRKSREQAERAKRKTLRQIKKNPHKKPVDQTTLEMSEYFVLGTSLKTDLFSAERILELYRLRWQVKLAFKRLTSITQCRAWLYGKMLYALLRYAIVDKGSFFLRGGIYAKYLESHESLWRELSVAMFLISQAIRPHVDITVTLSHREIVALLLAETPRQRVNALSRLF